MYTVNFNYHKTLTILDYVTRSWDSLCTIALRTCGHETTKHSQSYLMTVRDPLLTLDILLKPGMRYMGEEGNKYILEQHHKAMITVHNRKG